MEDKSGVPSSKRDRTSRRRDQKRPSAKRDDSKQSSRSTSTVETAKTANSRKSLESSSTIHSDKSNHTEEKQGKCRKSKTKESSRKTGTSVIAAEVDVPKKKHSSGNGDEKSRGSKVVAPASGTHKSAKIESSSLSKKAGNVTKEDRSNAQAVPVNDAASSKKNITKEGNSSFKSAPVGKLPSVAKRAGSLMNNGAIEERITDRESVEPKSESKFRASKPQSNVISKEGSKVSFKEQPAEACKEGSFQASVVSPVRGNSAARTDFGKNEKPTTEDMARFQPQPTKKSFTNKTIVPRVQTNNLVGLSLAMSGKHDGCAQGRTGEDQEKTGNQCWKCNPVRCSSQLFERWCLECERRE